MGHKEKRSKESKDKRHEKRRKKERKNNKSHHRRHFGDSSSSEDTKLPDVNFQLHMGRAAARALREILAYKYELRDELRQLARHLEGSDALDISGISDDFLLSRLRIAFDNMIQLRKTSAGHYLRRKGASSIISFVAPFLEESPASLASYVASMKPEKIEEAVLESEAKSQKAEQPEIFGPTARAPEENQRLMEEDELQIVENEQAPARRVLGPALPPPEMLAAAAAAMETADDAREGQDDEDPIGPPPPEYLEGADLVSMDVRSAEVVRVIGLVRDHEASAQAQRLEPSADGTGATPQPADAYAILGISSDAQMGEIKKRYWRLSLLIHPDKCNHPESEIAFQAVAIAAAELQDPERRAAMDNRRKQAAERKEAEAFYAQQERDREWRVARGEATPEDLSGPVGGAAAAGGGGITRDSWMTQLPERVASTAPPTGNKKAFSARSALPRQGAQQWTAMPGDRALALEGGPSVGPARLEAAIASADGERTARTSAIVDAYNSAARGKSLLETHIERQEVAAAAAAASGRKRKSEKNPDRIAGSDGKQQLKPSGDSDWDRSAHPWRPFDREKDLEIKPTGRTNPQELLKNMKGLKSRFGGGNSSGGRTFL